MKASSCISYRTFDTHASAYFLCSCVCVLLLYLGVNDTFCEPCLQNFRLVVHLPDT